ncbi:MAG: hypothetical protein CL878_13755 [Dehalococcoidia bacterium]|nr:hypothetical protein [Dehalococcoidia bacterium]
MSDKVRRRLLLAAGGLFLTSTRCAPLARSLEPLHSAEARFHDPLASGVIDRERWIVDSLPGAEVYATSESLRLVVADGLTATARPRLPTLDPRPATTGEAVTVREDLHWEALIHRRLQYLTTVTVELTPDERPWHVQVTEWGVQVVEQLPEGIRNHDIQYLPANDGRYHAWRISIRPEAWHLYLDGHLRGSYLGTHTLLRARFGATRSDPLHGGTIDLRDVVYVRRPV